ncbi:MAG: transposase [Deltaproteobacteria bacterium]|nr:transposase [Deltaproteobacteria bacterium]
MKAIDETFLKRKHGYVTVVIDSDSGRVFDLQPGKGTQKVDKVTNSLEEHGGYKDTVKTATSESPAVSAGHKKTSKTMGWFTINIINKGFTQINR